MHTTIKLLLIGALCQVFTAEATLLVSGEIKASDNQNFYSPKTDTWRVEVKWIKPEGEVVAPNDVVVVFDSGNIASQIEQTKVTLFTAQEELQRIKNNNGQSALEGEYAVKRNELLLEKARIDASVPKKQLSAYDYEKYQLELEKAAIELNKAKQNLEKIITNNDVALKKQQLLIEQTGNELERSERQLDLMSLKAERAGPVIYGQHPWNGEKVFVGMTAQPGWKIANIPSLSGLYIEAWIHEVDFHQLKLGQVADLKFDAFPSQSFKAELVNISTQPEERKPWGEDAYFRTEFKFANSESLKLIPGMSAQLALQGGPHD